MTNSFFWKARIYYPQFQIVYCNQWGIPTEEIIPENIELKDNYTDEELWKLIRTERNRLLSESDWTQLLDSPLTTEKRIEWQTYRQQLRDFPQNIDFDNWINNSWPQTPS